MISKFFTEKIKENFPFELTSEQELALDGIVGFLFLQKEESVFLLKGFAGTGKSSLLGALVKTMTEFKQKTVLLAPTGRAAKVFSSYANHPAFTIHKKIYRQQKYSGETGSFGLMDNLHKDTLFIVDEASMISNNGLDSSFFGTGRLLDDLIHFVYSGENCRMLLIGDSAQLPPVGEDDSPALQKAVLEGYGLEVHDAMLSQIVRQAESSGILYNATNIRNALNKGKTEAYPKLKLKKFTDIVRISGEELIDEITAAYDRDGLDNTMIISRSNKRSNIYNQGIRNRILYREEELSAGDMLMITKNNYYWTENIEGIDFLANGEIVEVLRVRREQELYGFRFCEVTIKSLDYDMELEVKILMDTLHSEAAGLTRERSEELFLNVLEDYADISTRAGKMKKMKVDPFYNAVQVKFAYAITCHKAQGGEWANVFLDLGYISEEHLGINFYRWLYTAITRASSKLYLVNLPDEFV
ncbi:exodeoxyribonuclease-5 [Dysgonomonas sp. PFB1-18]|uniref:ATP-dependent DNA helicase n=1 Tax=unclassified Dysgonomonas TaxID=2630389 RepID=UPI00247622A8|nr:MULTISPECIES: AAA family ATPase [unclassified Dysgonomonas]MDH6308339.1 exodeoxyribonuclease-5 [Dysgonomonas sp. PF1-14]MDH6338224.1 exodeoxyribonuclease-5 [Dysgonomonas sp. PF1-16]MDH6379721.1 exodeoxyribonuclease-5 [Dysgonomonas sp. PFB1-18]MDH6397190.1 exodeoxyribonuclease-5 [Dysgonomonas sp. PF1-23]